MNIVWDAVFTSALVAIGVQHSLGGYVIHSLVNNVREVRYSLGYRIHSDTGSKVPEPDPTTKLITVSSFNEHFTQHKAGQTKFTVYRHKIFYFECGQAVIIQISY